MYETLFVGKPVLCSPWLGDQMENCQRAVDAGVGLKLLRNEMTSPDAIHQSLVKLFDKNSHVHEHIKRVSDIVRIETKSAATRTVEFIERMAAFGYDSAFLVPQAAQLGFWQQLGADLWLIVFGVFVAVLLGISCICCCVVECTLRPKKKRREKRVSGAKEKRK